MLDERQTRIAESLLFVVLIVLFFILCAQVATSITKGLDEIVLVPMVCDIFGMGICLMLYLTLYADRYHDVSSRYFFALVILVYLVFLFSIVAYSISGDVSLAYVAEFTYTMEFFLVILALVVLWFYLRADFHDKGRLSRPLTKAVLATATIGNVLLLINVFTGLVFYIDDMGRFVVGNYGFAVFMAPLVIAIICVIGVLLYTEKLSSKVAVFCFSLFPVITVLGCYLIFGLDNTDLVLMLAVLALYGTFYVRRSEELMKKDAELVSQRAQILVSQIQPHFMYNALTSIMAIKGNPPETRDAIADFGKYLRGNLDTLKQRAPIPIMKELNHVETFMMLERLNLGDGLEFRMDVRGSNFLIPALSIQKLLEKCIENGYPPRNPKGRITLSIVETDNSHVITLEDDGTGFDTSAVLQKDRANVFGIHAVEARIREQVHGVLDIESNIGCGTIVTIAIPKTKAANKGLLSKLRLGE